MFMFLIDVKYHLLYRNLSFVYVRPVVKCGFGGGSSAALEWRRRRRRRGGIWGGGISLPVGCGLGIGHSPFRKICVFSPSKWCILMHSGIHFTPVTIVTTIFMTSTVLLPRDAL